MTVNLNVYSEEIEISLYHQKEQELLGIVTSLSEEVQKSQENCESDSMSTVIPQTIREGKAILQQQDEVIRGLTEEKENYERRYKEYSRQVEEMKKEREMSGKQPVLVNLEDNTRVHNLLLKLYSLKRIIRNSFGIVDITQDGDQIDIHMNGEYVKRVDF